MATDPASGRKVKSRLAGTMATNRKPANAFVTARKGFCYLTIKSFGRNHEMMRIRAYKLEPDEKRHMRRLYPDVAFDWKKITQQLGEKREDCRRYRTRPKKAAGQSAWRSDDTMFGIYEPGTRTIYTDGIPSTAAGVGRLLDAILQLDRGQPGSQVAVHENAVGLTPAPDGAPDPIQPTRRRTRRSTARPSSTK